MSRQSSLSRKIEAAHAAPPSAATAWRLFGLEKKYSLPPRRRK
jgi:hypothetical protein